MDKLWLTLASLNAKPPIICGLSQISALIGMSTVGREIAAPDVVERADDSECDARKDRVPGRSLIAVVKLVAVGIAGQAHGSLRGRHFDRLIMALDRLSRPMWCSRLSGRTSTRIPGIGLDCAIVLTGRSRWSQLTRDNVVNHAISLGSCDDQRKGSPEIHIA